MFFVCDERPTTLIDEKSVETNVLIPPFEIRQTSVNEAFSVDVLLLTLLT